MVLNQSTFRNDIFKQKWSLKIQKKFTASKNFPTAFESKGVTHIRVKDRELLFHPDFIYGGFTSLVLTEKKRLKLFVADFLSNQFYER